MNADNFEHRLQRQPRRAPPAAWRAEILAAAQAARGQTQRQPVQTLAGQVCQQPGPSHEPALFPPLSRRTGEGAPVTAGAGEGYLRRLRDWLWPHPVAWGALAACWVLVVALNSAAGAPSVARVHLAAGSTSTLALQATDWGDLTALSVAAQPSPPAPKPSPKLTSPTSRLIRRHETQAG